MANNSASASEFKVPPPLQRQAASLASPKPEPRSARNLLLGVFKKGWWEPPSAQMLQVEHAQVLLKTPTGRDFALVTAAGVEFKVHSVMLIGGSNMLQEGLFPGGAPQPNPPTLVNLPPNFHPILVDRVVSFIYTSDYDFVPITKGHILKPDLFHLDNATFIPVEDPPSPAVTALAGIYDYKFHLHMYALAEELDYAALKAATYAKLVAQLIVRHNRPPPAVKGVVTSIFAPPGSSARICKDEDGSLQNLAVAAVLGHQAKYWGDQYCKEFADSLQDPEYMPFWDAYNTVKEQNPDLIKIGELAKEAEKKWKEAAAKRRRTGEERRLGSSAKTGVLDGSKSVVSATGSSVKAGGVGKSRRKDRLKKRHEGKAARKDAVDVDDEDVEMEVD